MPTKIILLILAVAGAIALLTLTQCAEQQTLSSEASSSSQPLTSEPPPPEPPQSHPNKPRPNKPRPKMLADLWPAPTQAQADEIQFDVPRIHRALATITLDDDDNIILDDQVLESLRQAFEYNLLEWTPDRLQTFINIVQEALPQNTADQAAKLINDYNRYLEAKKQLLNVADPNLDLEGQRQMQAELEDLRALYLGEGTANALFEEEEAITEFIYKTIVITNDPSLTPAEQSRRQAAASEALKNRAPKIPNWKQRYQSFQQEKQAVLEAGLTATDQQQQIDRLIQQHFTPQEQAQARHLNLDGN